MHSVVIGELRNSPKYHGIFKEVILAAVSGERMKMDDLTEVSPVVTHSRYTGLGYAKQQVSHTVNKILDENRVPYLHVAEKNIYAIKLREKLGFAIRRKIIFWNFGRTDNSIHLGS